MSNTNHTPGPWNLEGNKDSFEIRNDHRIVCKVDWYPLQNNNIHVSEVKANAKLIAAAPELFNTLKTILFEATSKPDEPLRPIIIELIEATIKKATE